MTVPVMDRAHMIGNHALLACGEHHVLLAHLRRGSLRVALGAEVAAGDRIGAVGNSGNSSEPHLHLHVQTPGTAEAPISGDPLPFTVAGRYLVRNDVLDLRR
jgi:murein DD-endopeptidase MepM/ murein hydrolase activator NlpD